MDYETYHTIKWMAMNAFAYLFAMFLIRFTVFVLKMRVWWIKCPNIWRKHVLNPFFHLSVCLRLNIYPHSKYHNDSAQK